MIFVNDSDQYCHYSFPSFYDTAIADATLQYLIAFLVLLSTVKLLHLLRLNPKMNMITAALQRAWNDIYSFLVIIVIMFLAYSISVSTCTGYILFSHNTFDQKFKILILFHCNTGICDSDLFFGVC